VGPDLPPAFLTRENLAAKPLASRKVIAGSALERALAIEISRQCGAGCGAWNHLNGLVDSIPAQTVVSPEIVGECFAEIQAILVAAGIVSAIFWPKPLPIRSSAQKAASVARGKRMCVLLGVPDTSPLNDKVLRNSIEHVDERFEDHHAAFGPGQFDDFYLARRSPAGFVLPSSCARAYIYQQNELWLFGEHRDLQTISRALWDLGDSFTVPLTVKQHYSPDGSAVTSFIRVE